MKRVLLIDDDDRFCNVAISSLQPYDLEIVRASSGASATFEFESSAFDLVILDGSLPDTTGLEWLHEIRTKGYSPEVIFVSASWRDTTSYRELINRLDVRLIIHKPVTRITFAEQVLDVLKQSEVARATRFSGLDEELRQLAIEYANHLPGEFQRLQHLITLVEFQRDVKSLTDATGIAHRLHGTAGTYGFTRIGELMGAIEERLNALRRANGIGSIDTYQTIASNLHDASEELAKYRASAAAATATKPAVSPRKPDVLPQRAPSAKVLVVDDDPFFVRRIEQLVSSESIRTTSFTDTLFIDEILQDVYPDVLVLDINMPGVSGLDICRRIRQDVAWSHLKIIIVSADCSQMMIGLSLAAGADKFVSKQSKNTELLGAIKDLVRKAENPQSGFNAHIGILQERTVC